ncbi:hypothetical protein E2C01_036462 [Portunus trituberculatus]|uniref:Uncharacterized protein n=1 Tax=Portunus trituberculatus TaxID=210409 RepID=A0A5B7F6S7_PORTR|nr:hypothetical protein [Portunus trituberculatus]
MEMSDSDCMALSAKGDIVCLTVTGLLKCISVPDGGSAVKWRKISVLSMTVRLIWEVRVPDSDSAK